MGNIFYSIQANRVKFPIYVYGIIKVYQKATNLEHFLELRVFYNDNERKYDITWPILQTNNRFHFISTKII